MSVNSSSPSATAGMSCPVNLQALPSGVLEAVFTPENVTGRSPLNSVSPLSFPKSRSALWDGSPAGDKLHLQLCAHRQPRMVLMEKALRLAQRHARHSNKPRLLCFLLGSMCVDADEEGVTVTLDRFDPGRDQAGASGRVPSALLPGDVLVPCWFSTQTDSTSDAVVQSEAELHHCFKVLQQCVSSRQTLDLSQLIKVRGRLVCSQQSDAAAFVLRWSAVCPSVGVDVQPVRAVPIIPTALLRSLTSVNRPHAASRQRGFLTMDQTRKLLLLLESDPKASNLPLVGLWLSGVTHVYNPQVWAWCLRFLYSSTLRDRVLSESHCFLLVLFGSTHRAPQFFQCRGPGLGPGPGPQLDYQLLTASQCVTLYQQVVSVEGRTLQCELGSEDHSRQVEVFREAQTSFSRTATPAAGLSVSDQDSGVEDEDLSPRPSPSPHLPAQQARRVQPSVPELSLLIDSFSSNQNAWQDLGSTHRPPPPADRKSAPPTRPAAPPHLHSTPNSNLQQPCSCCSSQTYDCTPIFFSPGLHPVAPPPPSSLHPAAPPSSHHHTPPPSSLHPAKPPSSHHHTPPHSSLHPAKPPSSHHHTSSPSCLHPAKPPSSHHHTPPPSSLHPAAPPSSHHHTPPPSSLHPAAPPSSHHHTPPPPSSLQPAIPPSSHHHTPPPSSLHPAAPLSCHQHTPPPSSLHPAAPPSSNHHTSPPPSSLRPATPPPSSHHHSPPPPSNHPTSLSGPPSSIALSSHHHTPSPFSKHPAATSSPPAPALWHDDSPSPHPSRPAADPVPPPWVSCPSCVNQRCDQVVGVPSDTYQLLLHQDRQLRLLQAQVQMLLEAQGKLQSSGRQVDTQTPRSTASIAVGTGASLFWGDPIPSPLPHQEVQVPPPSSSSSSSSSSSRPPSHNNLSVPGPVGGAEDSDITGQEAGQHSVGGLQSPVLGESVSMYEPADEQQSFYHNLMSQLTSRLQESDSKQEVEEEGEEESRRRSLSVVSDCSKSRRRSLSAGSESSQTRRKSLSAVSDSSQTSQTRRRQSCGGDPVIGATVRQLQQLGVDVDQEDLTESERRIHQTVESSSTLASINPAAVLSRLRVSEPSASSLFPGGSVDLSLEANAIALRYLNDAQLSRMSLGGHAPRPGSASSNESLLSPSNMSLATRKYMRRYGLIEEEDSENEEQEVEVQEVSVRQPLTEALNVKLLPQSQLIRDLRPKMQLLAGGTEPNAANKENCSSKRPSLVRANSRQTEGSVGNILDLSRLRQLPKLF